MMASLTPAQLQQFADEGYLVVENVLDPVQDIQPLLDEYNEVLDGLAEGLLAEGAIRSTYRELPFADRLTQICMESQRLFSSYFDISLPQAGVTYDTPIHVGPAVFNLLRNPRVLDVVESIVGPEVFSNPVQHIRTKLPRRAIPAAGRYNGLVEKVEWHQDNGVILPEADEATILTVWMPLTDATIENGCMQVISRTHRQGLSDHCPSDFGVRIPASLLELERATPLPMKAGSLLLMHQRTIHASLDNVTNDQVRISFDLRYQPVGQPSGRPAFPGFVARSKSRPEAVLDDAAQWATLWLDTREHLARLEDPLYNRWDANSPACA
ncbi:MAG: phytanoyl-CoA dioxygenase family protein [Chloroflexi bacterium]|nr:phytanoyl-CoA dioxygenase family protein [Chloroflexota bacterium]